MVQPPLGEPLSVSAPPPLLTLAAPPCAAPSLALTGRGETKGRARGLQKSGGLESIIESHSLIKDTGAPRGRGSGPQGNTHTPVKYNFQ